MTVTVCETAAPLAQAQFLYAHCLDELKGLIDRLKAGSADDPKKVEGAVRAFSKAMQTLLDEQAKLGKHVAGAATLDLKGARDEIVQRLARWTERG